MSEGCLCACPCCGGSLPAPWRCVFALQVKIPLEAWEAAFALCASYQHDPSVHVKVQGLVGILLAAPPPRVSPTLISRVLQVGAAGVRVCAEACVLQVCVCVC